MAEQKPELTQFQIEVMNWLSAGRPRLPWGRHRQLQIHHANGPHRHHLSNVRQMTSDDDLLRDVGQRIRTARTAIGWSQEDLAHRCGLHRTYIGSVERGERNLSVLNVVLIATVLQIDPATLVSGLHRLPS